MQQVDLPEYHKALEALRKRKFNPSLALAKELLMTIESRQLGVGQQASVLHLLAEIHNYKGRYRNQATHHTKALEYIETAQSLAHLQPAEYWQLEFLKAHSYILSKKCDAAQETLQKLSTQKDEKKFSISLLVQLELLHSTFYYKKNKYEEAWQSIQAALALIDENEVPATLRLTAFQQTVQIAKRRHDLETINAYAPQLIAYAREADNKEAEFVGLNAIAVYHAAHQDFKTAMLNFRNALDKCEEIDYRHGTAKCLLNIGTIYAYLVNYDKALEQYTTVLNKYEDVLADKNTELILLNNIGSIYLTLGNLDDALNYFKRTLELSTAIHFEERRAHTIAQISRTLLAQEKVKEALVYAQEAETLLNKYSSLDGKQINYITLGSIYYQQRKYDLAVEYINKGLACAKEANDTIHETKGYRLMSEVFRAKGNFEKALDYQLIYSKTQEKNALEQHQRQIIDVEIQYEIQQKNKELKLLKKYQEKIKKQNEQLKKANKDLKQFAYAVSHDLKEPLRMIKSYVQLLKKRNHDEEMTEDASEFLGYINEGSARMNQLIEDLLEYATLNKDETEEWKEVDLSRIAEITIFNLRFIINEAGATIRSSDLPIIMSNHAYMTQIFQNLISNAIKFRKPNVSPVVRIDYQDCGESHLIKFQDNGIGIASKDLERIFVVFQRLHKRTEYEGSGIGLSICMKIAEKLGGNIFVESKKGQGSTFFIRLPKTQPSQQLTEDIVDE